MNKFISRIAGGNLEKSESREFRAGKARDMENLGNQKAPQNGAYGDFDLVTDRPGLTGNSKAEAGNLDNQKPAFAGNGQSLLATESQVLTSKESIADIGILSSSLLNGGPDGNRTRETRMSKPDSSPDQAHQSSLSQNESTEANEPVASVLEIRCPYCESKNFVKRGLRKNKFQAVQLYLCKNPECGRTFTASDVKGKKFPLNVIVAGITLYNLGWTLDQCCQFLEQKYKIKPDVDTLMNWYEQYKPLCRFERMRPYALKMYNPKDMVEEVTMAHRQLYRFRYHRAKMRLMLEEFGNRNLWRMKDYLDNVSSETPHQYFEQGERMSEVRSKLDKSEMVVKTKFNFANRLAGFVLGAVTENKLRHDALQKFMLANDSVTVATEVPVYIRREDIEHMENVLKFKVCENGLLELKGQKKPVELPRLLTGHVDVVQIRNHCVHLLDYKPHAAKEKPIEQLTWYALALSRLTGMRLFEFKCGWFDEKDYFEFYPLHVVKKITSQRKRKVHYKEGITAEIPKENILKVVPRNY